MVTWWWSRGDGPPPNIRQAGGNIRQVPPNISKAGGNTRPVPSHHPTVVFEKQDVLVPFLHHVEQGREELEGEGSLALGEAPKGHARTAVLKGGREGGEGGEGRKKEGGKAEARN